MSNRYTNVNFDAPFSSMVPLPFQEAAMAAGQFQKSFDHGQLLPQQLGELEQSIKNAPWHEDYKKELINQFDSKSNEIINKYEGNYADPKFKAEYSSLINSFKNSQAYNDITRDYEWFDKEYSKYKSNPENFRDIDETWDGKSQLGHSIAGKLDVTHYKDPIEVYKKIYDGVTEDGRSLSYIAKNGRQASNGLIYYADANGKETSISRDKIFNIAKNNFSNFLHSDGLYTFRKSIKDYLGEDAHVNGITPENYREVLGDELANYFENKTISDAFGYGSKYIHSKVDLDYKRDWDPMSIERGKKKLERPKFLPGYEATGTEKATNEYEPQKLMYKNTDLKNVSFKNAFGYDQSIDNKNKLTSKDGTIITPFNELPDKEKKVVENVVKNVLNDKQRKEFEHIAELYSQPRVPEALDSKTREKYANFLQDIYSKAARAMQEVNGIIKDNTLVTGISDATYDLFGSDITKPKPVDDFFAGIGTNGYVFDPDTKTAIPLQDFKSNLKLSKGATARLVGDLDPKNSLTSITGHKGFSNGYQIIVDGKLYYITGPDYYVDSETNQVSTPMMNKLREKETINDIWNSRGESEFVLYKNIMGIPGRLNSRKDNDASNAKGSDVFDFKFIPQDIEVDLENGKTIKLNLSNYTLVDKDPKKIIDELKNIYNIELQNQLSKESKK